MAGVLLKRGGGACCAWVIRNGCRNCWANPVRELKCLFFMMKLLWRPAAQLAGLSKLAAFAPLFARCHLCPIEVARDLRTLSRMIEVHVATLNKFKALPMPALRVAGQNMGAMRKILPPVSHTTAEHEGVQCL